MAIGADPCTSGVFAPGIIIRREPSLPCRRGSTPLVVIERRYSKQATPLPKNICTCFSLFIRL